MINNSFYESKNNFGNLFDKEINFNDKLMINFSGKYIEKMFSLKTFLVSESIFKLVCFYESCRGLGKYFTGMFHVGGFAE